MKYMSPAAAPEVRIHEGRYACARMRRARQTSLAERLMSQITVLDKCQRAAQEAEYVAAEYRADRDASGDDFDDVASELRLKMAAVSVDAVRIKPYTQVYAEGVGYFVNATIDDNETVMKELATRVHQYLPEGDPLRETYAPQIDAAVQAWTDALSKARAAQSDADRAANDLSAAKAAYDSERQKVWAELSAAYDKKTADRLFGG